MRWPELLVLSVVSLLTGAIFWWLPRMRRGGLYFGVTVDRGFRGTSEEHGITRDFRLAVVAVTLLTLVLEYFAVQKPANLVSGMTPLVQVAGAMGAWIWAWSRARPHAAPPSQERTAPLGEEDLTGPWLVAAAAPLLAMIAAALYLNSVFDLLPQKYPMHWNASGVADGFAEKSWRSVFFGTIMGSGVILMLVANVGLLARYARRGPGGHKGWTNRYLRANLRMLTILSWGLGLLFAVISLVPVFPKDAANQVFLGMMLLPLALLAITLLPMMKMSEEPDTESDQTPDDCWKLGIVYYNPQDPALVVPKRDGIGYSMNFAQPFAWLFMVVILSFVLAPLLLLDKM